MDLTNVWICARQDSFLNHLADKIESSGKFRIVQTTDQPDELKIYADEGFPSIIILDLDLTGEKTGFKYFEMITSKYKTVKPVVILPKDDEKVIYLAVCHGVYHYILKDQPINNVAVRLEEVVKSNTPLASIIKNKISKSFVNVSTTVNEFRLTEREKEILNLIIGGLTKRKIAELLNLSYHTIDSHLRNIYRKLGVQSKSQAITKALKGNLVTTQ
jgi:DNA-binding NarL/FixJ family response regulator